MRKVVICIIGLVGITAGCGPAKGPQLFPTTGMVQINGTVAESVIVQLHHQDPATPGEYKYPTGVTSKEGKFQLESVPGKTGALAGEYIVTFTWMSSPGLDGFDKLNGAFSSALNSTYRVTIPAPNNILPPFEIQVPEDKILRQRPARPAGSVEEQ